MRAGDPEPCCSRELFLGYECIKFANADADVVIALRRSVGFKQLNPASRYGDLHSQGD